MAVEETVVNSLQELVGAVTALQLDEGSRSSFWFRGISCVAHDLRPKIYRDDQTPDAIFERESRLLTRFRQRSLPYWTQGYPQTAWEHLFAMQHYGVPTRLLDWSENLFVATYFASLGTDHEHDNATCDSIVWCIDPVAWNRATPFLSEFGEQIRILNVIDDEMEAYAPSSTRKRQRTPVAIFGTHNTNRILAQRGTFMVWGNENRSLEEFSETVDTPLRKFVLRMSKVDLQTSLRKLGFTETMFFPDMSSLASELTFMEGWK